MAQATESSATRAAARTAPRRQVIRTHSVSGEVGAFLLRLIETEVRPGDRLPTERALVDRLGVSRASVREALRDLETAGVVERTPGRGTTVVLPSESARALVGASLADVERGAAREVADVAELRLIIEPAVAALAAGRAGEADLLVLERALADTHAGMTPEESLAMDVRFHVALARAAHNPLLLALCETATSLVAEVRARSHATSEARRISVDGHRGIYHAVLVHDPEAARQAMTAHLGEVAALSARQAY